ncbi:ABC transporter ATP-binding protein [Mesomycoplasma lagogenitalium]|uniref:ABC transporter ATP-binding protein n=1 Tax=Mesomycoplasma lagogenitalium TaxID=171286 RepID=A0ABY8LU06_9BACT|nr:ABC transporter ATP-binding protein [Mesomycoplasma lagogenitalium]WGI36719.1 ABC transporter ATP-binding protein [Mesomycoplasma lagogenitalium]
MALFKKKEKENKQKNNANAQSVKTEKEQVNILSKKEIRKIKRANNKPKKKIGVINNKNTDKNIIEVKNVTKFYLSGSVITHVLKGISLNIEKGDFAVLFGKSGSGKSTLLNIISGLDRASDGEVIVANNNLTYYNDSQLTKFRRDNVSFIFQNYNLLQNLNGYDNVETGAYLQKDKKKVLNINDLFKEFEIEEIKYKYPSQMSGGQQQRISILRALSKNADIIFADEPTGALDEKTSRAVLKVLQYINKKYGTTIVMVSHDPTVAELCNKIIKLSLGKISDIIINENPKQL